MFTESAILWQTLWQPRAMSLLWVLILSVASWYAYDRLRLSQPRLVLREM
ncbi:hypothetical protein LINPERPRIM_LOCUS38858 [Linum perenne]